MVIDKEKRESYVEGVLFIIDKYLTRNMPNSTDPIMPYYHVAITRKTGGDRWAFAFNMSRETVENEIIAPLRQQKMFMCDTSMISPMEIEAIEISETEEPASKILAKTRVKRIAKRFFGSTEEPDHINDWTIIRSGKDVTRKLIKGLNVPEEEPKKPEKASKLEEIYNETRGNLPDVSKDELKNYLEEFLRLYRTEVKKRYSAYFNEFPFYSAIKAVGVISLYHVYIFFTKDGEPKKTAIEVFDENDIPELAKVKDAMSLKEEDIFALLGVKTRIPDLVQTFWQEHRSGLKASFVEPSISKAVEESIKNHYTSYVETGKDPTYVISGEYKSPVISKYTFLCNTMDDTALSNKIEEIIDKIEGGEVLVAGWIDSAGMRLLSSLTKRNIKFRVITHRPPVSEKGKSPSDTSEVFSKLIKAYAENVRVLPQLHTRLLISDKEALVSTADLTKESLQVKYEAGISTTDGSAIIKMKEFFEKLWEASTKLSTPKTKGEKEPISQRTRIKDVL